MFVSMDEEETDDYSLSGNFLKADGSVDGRSTRDLSTDSYIQESKARALAKDGTVNERLVTAVSDESIGGGGGLFGPNVEGDTALDGGFWVDGEHFEGLFAQLQITNNSTIVSDASVFRNRLITREINSMASAALAAKLAAGNH